MERRRGQRARRRTREGVHFVKWTHESAIEAVAVWMREHGRAPLARESGRGGPLPAAKTMHRKGFTWTQLVAAARSFNDRRTLNR